MRGAIEKKVGALASAVVRDPRWRNETLNVAILGMILYGYALAVGRLAFAAEIEDIDAAVHDSVIKHVGAAPKWTSGLVQDAGLSAFDKERNPANYELIGVGHSYFGVDDQESVLETCLPISWRSADPFEPRSNPSGVASPLHRADSPKQALVCRSCRTLGSGSHSMHSFFANLRASMALGRASRFQKHKRVDDALREYKRGLAIIGTRRAREDALCSCTYVVLAVYAENLAVQLGSPGLSLEELVTTLHLIVEQERQSQGASGHSFAESIPLLEERISLLQAAP